MMKKLFALLMTLMMLCCAAFAETAVDYTGYWVMTSMDIGGVVVPYEMFDTSGMQIKDGSPFAKTFIFGYASPGGGSYIPDEKAFDNEGYETNQCRFVRGTAEKLVAAYLDMLNAMK